MDQEGHAEAMSIVHKSTGKVYRHHMPKGLPRVRPGMLVDKVMIEKSLKPLTGWSILSKLISKCDDAEATQYCTQ